MAVSLVVAHDEDFGIGKNGAIPWSLPSDLKRFKDLTFGHIVIMGALTWNSLPKKLPHRLNYVVSRGKTPLLQLQPPDAVFPSLQDALTASAGRQAFIIGGEVLYRAALEAGVVSRIIATEVVGCHDCDAYFPDPSPYGWHRMLDYVGIGYSYVTWSKKKWN